LRYLDAAFVEQAGTLTLIGPPSLGKTMLAICIAPKQVQLGNPAGFISAQALAAALGRATTAVGRLRVQRPRLSCEVLVLDELGYLPTEPSFGLALCEMLAGRYTKRPVLIPSHKRLTDRSLIVQEVALAAAIVDRIVHHGHVVSLKGPSWRAKDRPEMAGPPAEAAGSAEPV
jgi:DNA replication protein DnaC